MKKVAIVNRTNLKNYGSVLQVFALCEAIKKLGFDVEVLWQKGNLSKNWDIRPNKIINIIFKLIIHPNLLVSTIKTVFELRRNKVSNDKIEKFDRFVKEKISTKFYSYNELVDLAKTDTYLKFVCGSDQIWCSTALYVDPMMYLRFAPKNKRIAYAPSIGRDYIPNYNIRQMKRYISEIRHISIRETEGQRLIYKLINRDAEVVLDPTLLLSKKDWDLIKISNNRVQYILCYFLDPPTEENVQKIINLSKTRNITIISLNTNFPKIEGVEVVIASLEEFLGLVENAELIITDSYHGMLFSIIYNKNFWSLARNYQQFDQSSRQKSVLEKLGLNYRYIADINNINTSVIDYSKINTILDLERKKSLSYLSNALNS